MYVRRKGRGVQVQMLKYSVDDDIYQGIKYVGDIDTCRNHLLMNS